MKNQKFYKRYVNACRFTKGNVETVILDGVKGFMISSALYPVRELAHDIVPITKFFKSHFLTVELSTGLFGSLWIDSITLTPIHLIAQTLYSTKQAAMDAHNATVARYRADPRWQARVQP